MQMDVYNLAREYKTRVFEHNDTYVEPKRLNSGKVWVGESAKYLIHVLYTKGYITLSQIEDQFEEIEYNNFRDPTYLDKYVLNPETHHVRVRYPWDLADLNRCVHTINALGVTYEQLQTLDIWDNLFRYYREICYLLFFYRLDVNQNSDNILQLVRLAVDGDEGVRDILTIPSVSIGWKDWTPVTSLSADQIDILNLTFYRSARFKLLQSFLKEERHIGYTPSGF